MFDPSLAAKAGKVYGVEGSEKLAAKKLAGAEQQDAQALKAKAAKKALYTQGAGK